MFFDISSAIFFILANFCDVHFFCFLKASFSVFIFFFNYFFLLFNLFSAIFN